MATRAFKLEDFGAQKLSKNQQKTVRGGDTDPNTPTPTPQSSDPGKGGTMPAG